MGFFLALLAATPSASAGTTFAAGLDSAAASLRFTAGHILVGPQPGSSITDFQQALSAQGGRSLGPLQSIDVHVVEVPPGSEADVVARLAGSPHVRFAELDQLAPPAGTENDQSFGSDWHLAKINALTAWSTSAGSGITIAILDSGVDGTHPDLAAQMVPGWNFFDNNSDTADVSGHGTAVAGAAAAALNDGGGIAGVAKGARIMPVRIADATGYANWSIAALGLTWAADQGAQVANISFEGMAASSTMQAAASYFQSRGGTVIVAAGNTGAVDSTDPTETMIVVSATDNEDRITSWSTYGSVVAISAPGQDIHSTAMGGGYGSWSGTSMAAPIVAGTAALILALRPEFTPVQLESTLLASATDLGAIGPDMYYGYGRVNAAAAVQAAKAAPAATKPGAPVKLPTALTGLRPPSQPILLVPCARASPTIVIPPAQGNGVQAGTMLPFRVTVTNNDTTACDVSTFDLTRRIPAGWTATFLSPVMSLSPGTSGATALEVTSPVGTANSSNPITVMATNRTKSTFQGSALVPYVVANAVPGAPTIGTATAGDSQASVSFAAPASNGGSAITSYSVTSSPGGLSASGAASPLTVTGLINGTAYTFTVTAINAIGTGMASAASNAVTPAALIAVPGTATYYVTNAGNDSCDGTSQTIGSSGSCAWKTIAKVNASTFSAGDSILFNKGDTWREQLVIPSSGSSGAQITFGAYGTSGAAPVISGADIESAWVLQTANLYKKDLGYRNGVILEDGTPLKFVAWNGDLATTYSAMTAGSYTNDVTGTTAYVWSTDNATPDSHTIQVAKRDYGIYAAGKDHITVQNLAIEGARTHGIFLNYNNNYWTIENNSIKNIGGAWDAAGGYYLGNGLDLHSNTSNHTVTGNTIFNIFDSGISPQSSADFETLSKFTISNNTIYSCGMAGVEITAWSSNSSIDAVTVSGNTLRGNGTGWSGNRGGHGLEVRYGATNTRTTITNTRITRNNIFGNAGEGILAAGLGAVIAIANNEIYNNALQGIKIEDGRNPTSTGLIAEYNLIYGNVKDGLFYNVPNNTSGEPILYNNVFYDNGQPGQGKNVRIYQNGSGTRLVKNNIFYGTTSEAFYDDNGMAEGGGQNYNLYYRSGGNIIGYRGIGYDVTQWGNYKAASSQDADSPTPSDPLFISTSIPVLRLRSTSPAINAGAYVGLTSDYAGNLVPSGGAPDIGVYEYMQ